uniref:Uncharacterized protein n=1 Tax=Rhizophora mucronata TaxID=61149 RepID=A0A2P2NP17_RHIMU
MCSTTNMKFYWSSLPSVHDHR